MTLTNPESYPEFSEAQKSLEFKDSDHSYKLCGTPIPSVTTILHHKKPIPQAIKNTDKFILACAFGTAVHKCTECDDNGIERPVEHIQNVHKKADLWQEWVSSMDCEILGVEVPVYDYEWWYCGTIDRIMKINGELVVVDIKTSKIQTTAKYQVAAYIAAAKSMGIPVEKGLIVSLNEDEVVVASVTDRNKKKWEEIMREYNTGESDG